MASMRILVSVAALGLEAHADKCCYDSDLTADQCPSASDCETGYCSGSGATCKDCGGVFCPDTPPAPSPAPAPTPTPTPPAPAPTGNERCCYDADLTVDQCPTASDCEVGYCSSSGATCSDCGGVFCTDAPAPPAPTPTPPAPTPTGNERCCYDADLTVDQCPTASDCESGGYCSSGSSVCADCGGVFCTDAPSPTPTPPSPTPSGFERCCYDADLTVDQCPTASDCESGGYCSSGSSVCADCGGVFCTDAPAPPAPTPTPPAPSPVPPSGDDRCCYDADLTADQCPSASDCESGGYCSSGSSVCADCGGVFCAGAATESVAHV